MIDPCVDKVLFNTYSVLLMMDSYNMFMNLLHEVLHSLDNGLDLQSGRAVTCRPGSGGALAGGTYRFASRGKLMQEAKVSYWYIMISGLKIERKGPIFR